MGELKSIITKTRELETPAFFPVHNCGIKGDGNSPKYWEEIPDMKTMMVNAHYINSTAFYERLKTQKLHGKYVKDGVFFADSGGYQQKTDNITLDPVQILRVQENIGADIAATLDVPVFQEDDIYYRNHSDSIKKSVKNALLALEKREHEDMLIYATIQGSNIKVMMNMLDYLMKRGNFDGFAIGGLVSKKSNYRAVIDTIFAIRKKIGDLPLHIFGLGGPTMIPLMVYMGADTFDSSAFLKGGSSRLYFLPEGNTIEFQEMKVTKYLPCICPVCSNHKFDEIRNERKLIGLHNLWIINNEIRKLKVSILENDVEKYLDKRFSNSIGIKSSYRYAKLKKKGLI
jgi:tRNA-guanine family transglycosylase